MATTLEKAKTAKGMLMQEMTYEEFLDWADEDTYAEWVDGLDGEGRYQRATPNMDGKYASAVLPGFWINIGWLWQTPLPPVRQVLREWEAALSH